MHSMQPIVTDVRVVCPSVSLSVTNAPKTPHSEADLRLGFTVRGIWCSFCQITLASCLCSVL